METFKWKDYNFYFINEWHVVHFNGLDLMYVVEHMRDKLVVFTYFIVSISSHSLTNLSLFFLPQKMLLVILPRNQTA